jgi:cell division protein FtsA
MHVGGLQDVVRSPIYATGVGLVLYGLSQSARHAQSRFRIRDESIFARVKDRMRQWFFSEED